MVAVETENLTKVYGKKTVVGDLDLTVNRGAIFALLGANGSGKSTTIKMLTGLLQPTSGHARILGSPLTHENIDLKRKIGVLPENLALFEGLSVWEHISLIGEVYRLSRDEAMFRGEQLLKHLDLWEDRFTRVEECSFGMKKKCSLALALIHNPEVVFLDEPFEGIDPTSSRNIRDTISLAAGRKCTFFITSHSLEIMDQIISAFAIISHGEIVYRGDAAALRAENKSLETIYFEHIKNDITGELGWLGQ